MSKYKYDITIIVPCYNCSEYVDEMMKSLINQDYDYNKMEILLLNDGSTDDTLSIIEKYETDNVRVISKKNEGVSATRNLGLKEAKGEYILFLDPDDYLSVDVVKKIIKFFDEHSNEVDLVTYPLLYVYPDKKPMVHQRYKNCYTKGTAVYDLNEYYYLIQPTINVCIKNDLNVYFDINQKYSEDEKFNTTILMRKKKIGYVSDITYFYRRYNNSVTSKRGVIDLENIYNYYDLLQEVYNNHPFIQSIIMNNYNWRLREKCLFPNQMNIKEIDSYLVRASERLNKIDFTLFKNHVLDNQEIFYDLLALSHKNCSVKSVGNKYRLLCNNQVLVDDIDTKMYINYISINDNNLVFNGYIITPLFYTNQVKLYMEFDGKNKEVSLFNELRYQKKYKQNFEITINPAKIHELNFFIKYKDNIIKLNVQPIDWCSRKKAYSDYQVNISKKIYIKKSNIFNYLNNRFIYCTNFKFFLINILSFFTRKGNKCSIYFGDKDSLIYKKYQLDKSNNKRFYSKAIGYTYKLELLNCDYLITNKSVQLVVPFGRMRKYYIQASHFKKY